jgi:hypothetical protein
MSKTAFEAKNDADLLPLLLLVQQMSVPESETFQTLQSLQKHGISTFPQGLLHLTAG